VTELTLLYKYKVFVYVDRMRPKWDMPKNGNQEKIGRIEESN